MVSHLREFFDRFGINFTIDGPQLEYFVYENKAGLDISCSLTVKYDKTAGKIRVMTFYPGICLQQGVRYLSAVCFFMIMQHFAGFHHIKSDCRIQLNTRKGIYKNFFALLKDFDFQVLAGAEEDRIDIESPFLPLAMDTSMISERPLADTVSG